MVFTELPMFRFLGACRDRHVWFTSCDDCMSRNGQRVLVALLKIRERADKICLAWFMEGSSFNLVRSFLAVTRSNQLDWTGLAAQDTWFTYPWEISEELDFSAGCMMPYCKRSVHGDASLTGRALLARAVRLVLERLFPSEKDRARIIGSDGTHTPGFGTFGRNSCGVVPARYLENDNADDWDFANVPIYSHVNVRASICQNINVLNEFWRSDYVAVPRNVNRVFSRTLQNLKTVAEPSSVDAARMERCSWCTLLWYLQQLCSQVGVLWRAMVLERTGDSLEHY